MPTTSTIVSEGSLFAVTRGMVRASDGTIHVVYVKSDGSYNQIYHAYSTDEGDTWTEERAHPVKAALNRQPNIAIDSDDAIHIVWQGRGWGTNTANGQVIYRKKTTTGWEDAEVITDIAHNQDNPFIAIDSSDTPHIVWHGAEDDQGSGSVSQEIFYTYYTGSAWATKEFLTGETSGQITAVMGIDSDDVVHIVWRSRSMNGTYQSKWNLRYIYGNYDDWSAVETVTDVDGDQNTASIALDSDDNVHLVWAGFGWGTNTAVRNIQYRKRTSSWQTQESISDSASVQTMATMALDTSNNVYAVWTGVGWGTNTADSNIQMRKRTTSWQTQANITDTDSNQFYIVVMDANYPMNFRTSRPKTGFVFMWDDTGADELKFYASADLEWEGGDTNNFFLMF